MIISFSSTQAIAAAMLIAIGVVPARGDETKTTRTGSEPVAAATSMSTLDDVAATALCHELPEPSHRISYLGTSRAVSRNPMPSKEELASRFAQHQSELEAVLRERGLARVAKPLAEAIAAGSVSERLLEPGEVFEWMASRPDGPAGRVQTTGPVCLTTSRPYPAWQVAVDVEDVLPPPAAVCGMEVEVDCDARTLAVRAAEAAGLRVSLDERVILDHGETTWKGALSDPFTHHHVVTARAQTRGTKTVTTHHFVMPKICLNLALTGTQSRQLPGDSDTCEKTLAVERCEAPPPHCTIVAVAEAWKNEDFDVAITGHKDTELLSALDSSGRDYPAASPMSLPRPGRYTITGRATNETGETAECSAEIVIKPRWTVRAMGERLDPSNDTLAQASTRAGGVSERSSLSLATGAGVAVGLEYLFSDFLGLEGRLSYGELDSTFTLDLDDQWETDEDQIGLLTVTIGANFHLTPGRRVDVFTGPIVGWTDLGDSRFDVLGETVEHDLGQELALGVQVGLDVPFGQDKPWSFHFGVRYLDLAADIETLEIDLDPLSLALGVAYDF